MTLWPRVRFQHRFGAGPCFFRLPNRPSTSPSEQHWIEIAFSSFQMGRIVNQTCPLGHLKVCDNPPFRPYRDTNINFSIDVAPCIYAQFVEETGTIMGSSTGTFCGRLSDSQIYLTSSKSLTLYASPASETDHFNAYFDVLSVDALRKRYPEMRNYNKLAADGQQTWLADSRCDMIVRNCPNNCRISSPLFPVSAYPRNVTCRYRVVFDRADFQVVLGGQPGDRHDLSLHPHCQADRLIVYEKTSGSQQYQQVAKFCGRGTFPKV